MPYPTDLCPSNPTADDSDDLDSRDLNVGAQVYALEQSDEPHDETHEIELGDWAAELNQSLTDDEGDGPLDNARMDSFDLQSVFDDENQEDQPSQPEMSMIGEQLPQPETTCQDLDESADDPELRYTPGVSDAEIRWSAQPWCERRMVRAFTPRVALVGRGNLVLATGDSTDVLETATFKPVTEAPRLGSTSTAVLLDEQADQILISTTTGQLLLWNRGKNSVEVQRADDGQELDCVTRVCESAPGSAEIWALLSDGSVFHRTADADRFTRYRRREGFLSITPGESCLAAITRDRHLVHLSVRGGTNVSRITLPASENAGALAKRMVFLVSKALIVIGAREFGAWLSTDNGQSFCEIPGCQNMTAATLGTYAGRTYLWMALFCELDDRTELVSVDCRTKRAHKIATFTVVTDCTGPEDDPPERARLDGLYWDSAHLRLWAAGCFGLTCFEPPQSTQTSS